MMRRTRTWLVGLVAVCAVVAVQVAESAAIDPALVEILSGVDFVPVRTTLDGVLGASAETELNSIANDTTSDAGLRIRAFRALAFYRGPQTEATLTATVQANASATTGVETLYARAAMLSLATVIGDNAVVFISPILDNENRDMRSSAARALALAGSTDAIPALRERLNLETVPQVQLALSDAIRELEQGSN